MEELRLARENEEAERSSYTPLSFFYTKSTVYLPHPKASNSFPFISKIDVYLANVSRTYIPLSFFTTIVPDDAASMDMANEETPVLFRSYMEALMSSESNTMADEKKVSPNYAPLSLFHTMSSIFDHPSLMTSESNMDKKKASISHYIPLSCCTTVVMGNKFSESKVCTNSIPDDLVFSILSKLPIKSLKRFRCVRKSWSVLFENSYFMNMYINHFISRHVSDSDDYHTFILRNNADQPVTPPYLYHSEFHLLDNGVKLNLPPPIQQSGSSRSILSSTSVNGIFCLGQKYPINLQYVLWNPATEEYRVIPRSPAELSPQYPQNNLYLRHVFHGFGYDQVRDDFKVVQYVSLDYQDSRSYDAEETYFEIYSLKNNSWRTINMENVVLCDWCYSQSFDGVEVYVNGACHWLFFFGGDPIKLILVSFDLSDEVFLITPIGDEPYSPYTLHARLAVLNGSIALFSNYHDDIVFHISILGELGVSESWIKLYISDPLPSIQWPPIGFGTMGYLFFFKKDDKLAYVDLSTQRIEEVGITGGVENYFQVGLYKESLLPIGGSSN